MSKKNMNTEARSKVGAELDFASREAYNLLRTNISFAFLDQNGGRIVGVCSSCPHEGKTTTSINLAYALAESGEHVLLIDGDMRRPSVNETLELDMEPGLSEALVGKGGVHINASVLHANLDIMTSGHIPPNPSELIGSNKMEALLSEYREKYNYIIIDLPPVMSVSDPVAVSKYIDGMIIVVRHEKTKKRELTETIRQLEYANVKILGFVYNRIGKSTNKKKAKYDYESKK